MNYRDTYPSCEDCPFIQIQQAERVATLMDIQDSEMLIVAKQAALDHYLDVSIKISTFTLLQVMNAKDHGMAEEDVQALIAKVDTYDSDAAEVTQRSENQIAVAQSYIDTSRNIIELTDAITKKVASECPGYANVRYSGQEGCKSALIPFIDTENK